MYKPLWCQVGTASYVLPLLNPLQGFFAGILDGLVRVGPKRDDGWDGPSGCCSFALDDVDHDLHAFFRISQLAAVELCKSDGLTLVNSHKVYFGGNTYR